MKFSHFLRKNYNGVYLLDVLLALATFIILDTFFSDEITLLLCFLVGICVVTIHMKWHLRRRAWFWSILTLFALGHVILILSVAMPQEFKIAVAFAPLVILEGLALIGIIGLIEHRKT
ncbi:MAG TPA: hypothetical protein VNJ05_09650 [Sphingomicrobium sp.]|nr:hypothetical protein [Sphingomicrobium sp.]